MSSRNPYSGNEYNILRDILRRANLINLPLNTDETNMQEQIINFYPQMNLSPFSILNPSGTNIEQGENNSGDGESETPAPVDEANIRSLIQSQGPLPSEVPVNPSNSSLNPEASPFLPGTVPNLISNSPELDSPEEVENEDMEDMEDMEDEIEDGIPSSNSLVGELFQGAPPEIQSLLNRALRGETLNSIPNLFSLDVPLDAVGTLFDIRNPPVPTYEPNYLIENFKELDLGISEIYYPYDGSLIKIYIPTIIAVDNPYCQRLIRGQIINLKDILKEKEAALQIAYFIKTGEISPEVQPHHDELSGYSKQPLSEDNMKKLKYKNIKDTNLLETLDDSSNCSICQTPIKELLETDQEVIVLECGDYFCKDCIFQWLEQYQNKCPNCNKVLSSVEEEPKPRLTREEILENNYYKAAYFIIRYCSYYRQKQEINVQRLDQLNEFFIQQGGLISMNDCKTILEF